MGSTIFIFHDSAKGNSILVLIKVYVPKISDFIATSNKKNVFLLGLCLRTENRYLFEHVFDNGLFYHSGMENGVLFLWNFYYIFALHCL